jgi:hypothetical protein
MSLFRDWVYSVLNIRERNRTSSAKRAIDASLKLADELEAA